ncbi:17421_t:CDS:1, partial [Racocetra fulgida]
MCAYRIVGIVIFNLPTYTYADILSTAFNVFVMTTTIYFIDLDDNRDGDAENDN